jgi:integrase/recombinase XerC/integrase/recombinase XerD
MQKTELTLDELTRLLVNTKRSEGKSPQTIRWYRDGIGRYSAWLEGQQLAPTLAHFTLELVRAYTVDLQGRKRFDTHLVVPTQPEPLSDHSINSYLRVLRAFSSWLHMEGYTAHHVLARIKLPRTTEKVQDILTEEEIVTIARSLNPRTEIGARDQAIFLLLLDSGMRRTELCRLRMQDLNLDEGYAVVRGKGKKERPVRLGARTAKAVRFYLLHWRKPARPLIDAVFLTCRGVTREVGAFAPEPGEPLKPQAVGLMIKRVGCAAGVPRLHPHLLRHTFACRYLLQHRDPFALKSLLGHTTLAMTNHYCAAVQQMEIVRADAISVVDAIDAPALSINRRGRPLAKTKQPVKE